MDNNFNTQQQMPMQQMPMQQMSQQPKKKTGLIIGIVSAVVALIAIIVTIVLVLTLGGDDGIVGKWECTVEEVTMAFEFEDDSTGTMSVSGLAVPITWKLDGDKLSVTASVLGNESTDEFVVEQLTDDVLVLSNDGEKQEFKRVD